MRRSGGITSSFLTSALDGGEWSASRPCRFTPGERTTGTHWIFVLSMKYDNHFLSFLSVRLSAYPSVISRHQLGKEVPAETKNCCSCHFYAVHVVSKESTPSILPRTYCFSSSNPVHSFVLSSSLSSVFFTFSRLREFQILSSLSLYSLIIMSCLIFLISSNLSSLLQVHPYS
jgi:hypothetical protein